MIFGARLSLFEAGARCKCAERLPRAHTVGAGGRRQTVPVIERTTASNNGMYETCVLDEAAMTCFFLQISSWDGAGTRTVSSYVASAAAPGPPVCQTRVRHLHQKHKTRISGKFSSKFSKLDGVAGSRRPAARSRSSFSWRGWLAVACGSLAYI